MMMYLFVKDRLGLSHLGSAQLLESFCVTCQIWKHFSHYFFKYFLGLTLFLLSFWDSDDTDVRLFVTVPQVSEVLFIFFSQSTLLLRLGNLYCSICQFTSFLVHPLHSSVELIHLIFNFSYCIFTCKISIRFFIPYIILLRLSDFSFKCVHYCPLKHFYDGCFKILDR